MILIYILVAHIALAAFVLASFGYRYYQVLKNKTYPKNGIKSLFSGSVLLIISGAVLSLLSKATMTRLCVSSLALVTGLLVMEFGLRRTSIYLSNKS